MSHRHGLLPPPNLSELRLKSVRFVVCPGDSAVEGRQTGACHTKKKAKAGKCVECLACEVDCRRHGEAGGYVQMPIQGLSAEAVEEVGIFDVSVVFVPAPLVRDVAIEAIEAGIELCVLVPDRVPLYNVLEIRAAASGAHCRFVGPNTLGVLSPGRAVAGMIGGRAETAREWFPRGPVGVSSRSGGMTSSTAYDLGHAGLGAGAMVRVGGDSVVGLRHAAVANSIPQDA